MILMGAYVRGTLIAFPRLADNRSIISHVAQKSALVAKYGKKEIFALVKEALDEADPGATLGRMAARLSRKQSIVFGEAVLRNMGGFSGNREAIRRILREIGWVDRILRLTRSGLWRQRAEGAKAFGAFGGALGVEVLIGLLEDAREEVRTTAAYAITEIGGAKGLQAVARAVSHGGLGACDELPFILFGLALRRVDLVMSLLKHSKKAVQLAALNALANCGRPQVAPQIMTLIYSADPEVRAMAAKSLGRLQCLEARRLICGLLSDDHWEVRVSAARALRDIGTVGPVRKDVRHHKTTHRASV